MNYYIFLTSEGHTFQPNSSSQEEDIHNLQVLGIAKGLSQEEAFYNLLASNPHLNETSFNEVFYINSR